MRRLRVPSNNLKQYLDLASKRIQEVAQLVSRATSMPATNGPSASPAGVNDRPGRGAGHGGR